MNQVQTVLGHGAPAGPARGHDQAARRRSNDRLHRQAGLPGYENTSGSVSSAPRLDRAITERTNLAVKTALDLPAVREKLVSLGNTPRYETVDQFRATVKADRAKWADVVKASGASID